MPALTFLENDMAIRLKWKNPNGGASVVRIYRGVAPLDVSAMPAPIVEISDGSTSYLDNFPKYGESYYYVFSVVINGREVFTPNKYYSCVIDLGPGPKDLILGDFKLGYFGSLAIAELGISPTIYGSNVVFTTVHKIARNGKILYTPLIPYSLKPSDLIAAKCFTSGITARNDPNAGAGGTIREYGNRLYALRVAKMWDEANTDATLANYGLFAGLNVPTVIPAPTGKSEVIDLIRASRVANADLPARFPLGTDTTVYNAGSSAGSIMTCDFASATAAVGFYGVTAAAGALTSYSQALTTTGNVFPVIEYKGVS